MLSIDLLQDEELAGVVNVFISSLLPHSKYKSELFSDNLKTLLSFIHLNEFKLEYRLLVDALSNLNRIRVSFAEYEPRLTRESFQSLVSISIGDAILRPEMGVKDWLQYEGMSSNLKVETVKEETCQRLYARAMDLYDDCFDLQIPSSDAMNHMMELRAAFIAHVGVQSVNTQSLIIRHEVRVGRKKLCGFEDWMQYVALSVAEIQERLAESCEERTVVLDSMENSLSLLHELKNFFIPIANYGIPEIDRFTPILRHRLVVVVGKENIGKTKFAIDKAVNVLMTDKKVVYMCGETQKAKVYADIIINYVFKKYQVILRPEHVASPEECPEDIQKIIGMTIDELVNGQRLILCDAFSYGTLYEELKNLYDVHTFDVCVIDHSCALKGSTGDGSLKDKIDKLSTDVRTFRKEYPVCIMITSHPSTTAKESDNRGKQTVDSPTKGSQNLSTDADEVFVLRDNPTLQKQGLVMLENTKRRDANRVLDYIILRKRFDASAFVYDAADQAADNELSVSKQEAIRILEEDYKDESEYKL